MKPAISADLPVSSALTPHLRLLFAGAAAYSMSTLFSAMKPVLLTRYVEQLGLTESFAGLIVAMPFVGLACASVLLPWLSRRVPQRSLSAVFCLLLVLAEWLSAYLFAQAISVLLLQWLGGVAVGGLMGLLSREVALTNSRERLFGAVDMIAVLLMSFMVTAMGFAVGQYGLQGGYLVAAAISAVFAVVVLCHRPQANDFDLTTRPATLAWSLRSVAVVLMGVLFVTASGLGFAFMFSLAQRVDMDYALAGQLIGILLFLSAFACWAGGVCSARWGAMRPLAIAYVTCAVGWYIAVHTTSSWMFLCALVPAVFSLQFSFPILLSLSGSLDNSGQWAAVATPLLTSGFAWAAICAGLIVSSFGINHLATATAVGMLICVALLAFIASRN